MSAARLFNFLGFYLIRWKITEVFNAKLNRRTGAELILKVDC